MPVQVTGVFYASFMIDGDELERSYKHHLSDYSEWEQRDHASNWMLIKDNLGENLSIDETMLQEDLVTILSNKAFFLP